jgi:hypothetical protein
MMEAWAAGKLHGEPAQKLPAVFDWHEAHVGPRHGSANRLGIGRIALAGFSLSIVEPKIWFATYRPQRSPAGALKVKRVADARLIERLCRALKVNAVISGGA